MRIIFLALVAVLAGEGRARASGFEKSVMWSGKHSGYAGAATSTVSGGQSLFFNPAGLAKYGDVSLNYSPTWIKIDGYLASANKREESKAGPLPFFGTVASHGWNSIGFGVGAYVVGGEKSYYGNVDLSGDSALTQALRPTLITDLEILEYSLGAAIEVVPGLRFGASWRINTAQGELSTIKKTVTNTAYTFLYVKDVKQTQYDGWRLGAQYEAPSGEWGIGASYRSKVEFDAPGKGYGTTTVIPTQATTSQVLSDPVRIGLAFPEAYSLGAHYRATSEWKIVGGVDFVKYSRADNIYITGTANGVTIPNIPLEWKDMWNFRLGFEYTGISLVALRAGYSLTTQVTSSEHAKATLPPAGLGHLFAVGAGYSLMESLDLDGALEYSFNNGNGSMTMPTSTTKELLAGVKTDTKARVYALHIGATYRF
jgi:long-subunit fatty acid transport protein